jgi:hypothetical protein
LRVFSVVTGMAHLVLLFLCLRLLFPGQRSPQIVGLALGGFLPAHLYLSHHPTNEGLAALFVTAAIYFTLRILRSALAAPRLYVATGVCLGLALLTKFSAVLVLPFVFGVLVWHGMLGVPPLGGSAPESPEGGVPAVKPPISIFNFNSKFLTRLALAFLSMVAICGWHYARVYHRFGNPLIGNWDPKLPFAWWQDPPPGTGTLAEPSLPPSSVESPVSPTVSTRPCGATAWAAAPPR